MNPSPLKSKPSFGYDSARPSFITTGTPIFGYDTLANWFTVLNFETSSRTAAIFRQSNGKERDPESGLDYFGARYYGSALGRFTSADDGSDQDPGNPQSWNLYSYGRDNPLNGVDPTGRNYTVCDQQGQNCADLTDRQLGPAVATDSASAAGTAFSSEVSNILSKATGSVGNQGIQASSRDVAEQAAKEWVGEGAQPIVERSTGTQVGWKSADGMKIARYTSANNAQPYINLENKAIGGNLHVRF